MIKLSRGSRPKMAVVRAFPRFPEFKFYTAFRKFELRLIGNNSALSAAFRNSVANVESIYLPLKPAYLLDPISLVAGRQTHRSWAYFEDLENYLKDCDVINISDTFYFYCRQCAELSKRLKKPLVTIVWETIPHHPAIFIPPYSLNVREVVKNTNLFILRSKRALRFTDSLGISRERVKVIYKGIDLSMFHPPSPKAPEGQALPSTYNLKPRTSIKILYVGQLAESKGVDDLLKAFVPLSKEFPHLELLLAGTGPLEKHTLDLVREHPIRRLGFINYLDLPGIYCEADIFCSPSKDLKYFGVKVGEERFGYTLMEAQASGLPIVATQCGGIPEVVGENNLLVDPGDVEGLYRALKRLVEDRDLREKLGRANRKRAEKLFDLKKQARETEEAILSIL